MSSLDILVGDNGVEVNGALLRGTNLGFGVGIKLLSLEQVKVDGVGPGDDEEGKRDDHSTLGADAVCDVAENDWNDGTTGNGCDQEGSTTLGVTTKSSQCQSKDDGEDARLFIC